MVDASNCYEHIFRVIFILVTRYHNTLVGLLFYLHQDIKSGKFIDSE